MTSLFDEGIILSVISGRICFLRILRRHRRGIDRLLSAGLIDLWLRPDQKTVLTLSPLGAERYHVELDEAPPNDEDDDDSSRPESPDSPVWRPSCKIDDKGSVPCWQHPVRCPKEVGFSEMRNPHLIPDHREARPGEIKEPVPVETEEGVPITVGCHPAFADCDVRTWKRASTKLRRAAKKAAKKAKAPFAAKLLRPTGT